MTYLPTWKRIGAVALCAFAILAILAGIACLVLKIVLVIQYKDVPITELPSWVYWWVHG